MAGRKKNLAAELEAAPEAPASADQAQGAPRRPARGGVRPAGQIWDGCPVQPLGVLDGASYYLDPLGQVRKLTKHGMDEIRTLFGKRNATLTAYFPQRTKDGDPKPAPKFEANDAAAAMVAACAECGLWDPAGGLRGPGAWSDDDGGLIYHAGDAVLVGGVWRAPGRYGEHVYPARAPIARPAATPDPVAAQELLTVLGTWTHGRPQIDPVLTLGAVGAQMIGGALDWRPVTWIIGDAETGKSEFQKLLQRLHGGERGLVQAADASEAGIRSAVGSSTLPVAIDELEPDPDHPDKVRKVVELARRAASGGIVLRGSSDQSGHQSQARSSFLFSSILASGLSAQDRSRLILLELQRLPDIRTPLRQDVAHWRAVGAAIKGNLILGWPLWAERLDAWRSELARHDMHGRHANNFATALACACAALRPQRLPSPAQLADWVNALAPHLAATLSDVGSNADDMLTHLLSQVLDPWRKGLRYTVASWIQYVAALPDKPEHMEGYTPTQCNKLLQGYGLHVKGVGDRASLIIANKPIQGLLDLFQRTQWAGGVWSQAARRLPGASGSDPRYFNGVSSRGTEIPLLSIPGLFAFPGDSTAPANPDDRVYSAEDFL